MKKKFEMVIYHKAVGKEKLYRYAWSEAQARKLGADAFKKKYGLGEREYVEVSSRQI